MAKALYRSVTCNVLHTNRLATQRETIQKVWGRADVLKINEGTDTRNILRGLKDAAIYQPGGSVGTNNPIVWRKSVFRVINKGVKTVYRGGDGWGPSRGVTWVLLEHRASKKRVLEFNFHQIAKAWTTNTNRQGVWNNILEGIADEVIRVRNAYPGVPAVISGDVNKPGDVNFPGLAETEVSSPATYNALRYDRFWLVGGVASRGVSEIATPSDHDSLLCRIEVTANSAVASTVPTKKSPAPVEEPTKTPPAKAPPKTTMEDLRRRATFRARPRWRYFAQRLDGTGADGAILHPQLPLSGVEIEDMLTGHNSIKGTISPEFASLIADDGRPLLEEWGTAIWAEESGNIHGGGILIDSGFDGPNWSVECIGLTGYLGDLPYAASKFFVEADPLDIFRHIWAHVQAQPGGNLGLVVDGVKTGLKIGTELEQVEFDTQAGPVSFEAGPYKLAWYQTHDLADNADNLAADTPFDWHEEHYWVGDTLNHRLRIGYPKLGRRREDLRFVIGENIHQVPSVNRDGADYADEAWVLGAGEGSAMLRGVARKNINRLRRVVVEADPSLRSQKSVNAAASRAVSWRHNLDLIDEVVVLDHPHADVGSLLVGDEIQVQGDAGWVDIDAWYRVISRRIYPQQVGRMGLSLVRTDRIAA